jgi:hypothetical protein
MSVDNIVAIYRMATPEEKRDGVVWYARALADCMRIAEDTEVPLHIVVGVCAALSPNNRWDRNIDNTRDMVQAYINGDDIDSFKVSTYHAMKRKAWDILDAMPDHDGVISILNGQKIVSFYRNIIGDDTCTIDGHARNIYYGERHGLTTDKTGVGKREYADIQQAYVDAGKRVRFNGRALKAFEMQAITWVAWRRIHGIA